MRQTSAREGVQQASRFAVSGFCAAGVSKETRIHEEEVKAPGTLRYAYRENSSYSTVDFVKRALLYFGYLPEVLQTDNGGEFTHTQKTDRMHPLDMFCAELHIIHKLIRSRTPWHNGKVECSHRNDQERFYNFLRFYSCDDLQVQMKRYLRRSNQIPMSVLNWMTPIQKRRALEAARLC